MRKLLLLSVLGLLGCEPILKAVDAGPVPRPPTCGNGVWEDMQETCEEGIPASCKGTCYNCVQCLETGE